MGHDEREDEQDAKDVEDNDDGLETRVHLEPVVCFVYLSFLVFTNDYLQLLYAYETGHLDLITTTTVTTPTSMPPPPHTNDNDNNDANKHRRQRQRAPSPTYKICEVW